MDKQETAVYQLGKVLFWRVLSGKKVLADAVAAEKDEAGEGEEGICGGMIILQPSQR